MEKKLCELGEKIAKLMEEYKMRVYDLELINELIEKTGKFPPGTLCCCRRGILHTL